MAKIGFGWIGAFLCVAVVGCSGPKSATVAGGKQSVLRYPLAETPGTFDPARNESADTSWLLQNIFDGLVRFDENNRIAPCLADRWEISKDGLVYTFHLTTKARFHAPVNRQVTASDVAFSLNRIFLPATRATVLAAAFIDIRGAKEALDGKAQTVSGIRVVDPQTLEITLRRPAGYFLGELAGNYVVCPEAIAKTGGAATESSAIGSGPFRLARYQQGYRVELERNSAYHLGAPKLDRILLPVVRDRATAHTMFESGELDVARIDPQQAIDDAKNPKLASQLVNTSFPSVNYLALGTNLVPAFRDRRVRQAIHAALNKDYVVKVATQGASKRADCFLPPTVEGHDPSAPHADNNVILARKLLSEAGFPNGKGFPKLELQTVEKDQAYSASTQIVREDLKRVLNIDVDIRQRDAASFFSDSGKGQVPFYLSGWVAVLAHDFLAMQFRTGAPYNGLKFSSNTADVLLDKADAEMDAVKRADFYRAADRAIVDEAVVIPLYFGAQRWLVRSTVKDFRFNFAGPMPHFSTRIESVPAK